jgi:Domain of unknown function (DUF4336)
LRLLRNPVHDARMLQSFALNVWLVARPLRFLGLETGTRMTVVKLRSGELIIHSPVALDPELGQAIDALGPVGAIVAPCLFHHLYAGEWAAAYPRARLLGCPGLARKRPELGWTAELTDGPEPAFGGELDQVQFSACKLVNEVVLFHAATQTIICSDFMFNLARHPSALTRGIARVLGNRNPGPTLIERALIRDHRAARAQVDRIVGWGADRIVLAHGDLVESDATACIQHAYRWL